MRIHLVATFMGGVEDDGVAWDGTPLIPEDLSRHPAQALDPSHRGVLHNRAGGGSSKSGLSRFETNRVPRDATATAPVLRGEVVVS